MAHGSDFSHNFSEEWFLRIQRSKADGFPHVSRCEIHGFFACAIDFEKSGFVAHEEVAYTGDHFKVFVFGAVRARHFFGGVGEVVDTGNVEGEEAFSKGGFRGRAILNG